MSLINRLPDFPKAFREKARFNVCIAKDLAENFGGKKVDYLKRLNQKLRAQIIVNSSLEDRSYYAKTAYQLDLNDSRRSVLPRP
jgi:hypothetical protein